MCNVSGQIVMSHLMYRASRRSTVWYLFTIFVHLTKQFPTNLQIFAELLGKTLFPELLKPLSKYQSETRNRRLCLAYTYQQAIFRACDCVLRLLHGRRFSQ